MIRKYLSALAAVALMSMIAIWPVAAATTITVSPSNLNSWQEVSSPPVTDVTFVNGPTTPPAGAGSAHFLVGTGATNNDAAQLRYPNYNGTDIGDLTNLMYRTYVSNPGNTGQAPYILLGVDRNNDGAVDASLFFEPVYQNGTYGTLSGAVVPNQCGGNPGCVTLNTWQTWDALAGGWWSPQETSGTGGPPLFTLQQYAAEYPNAVIRNAGNGLGGLRLVAGFGNPPWGGFTGNVDALEVGVSGSETLFDFELQAPSSSSHSSLSSTNSTLSSTSSANSSVSSGNICPVSNANLRGYWKLNEGLGSTTADSSGNGHTGTLENSPTWTNSGATQVNPNPASLQFDGVNDQVRISGSNSLRFGTGSFTVSTFVKTTAGNRSVLGNFNGSNRGWGLYLYSNGDVNFFGYGTMGINDAAKPSAVLNNQWHHLAGVYTRSGSSLTIATYVDGVLAGTQTATVGDISSSSDLLLGRYLGQPFYQGGLDEVSVYDSALSPADIAMLAAGCPGSGSSSSMSNSSMSNTNSSFSSLSASSLSVSSQSANSSSLAGTSSSASTSSLSASSLSSATSSSLFSVNSSSSFAGNSSSTMSAFSSVSSAGNVSSAASSLVGNVPMCDGQPATVFVRNGIIHGGPRDGQPYFGFLPGGNGPDVIVGTPGNDIIQGGNGPDRICGRGGNDILQGGNGPDRIRGGNGNDLINGGNGPDVCIGGGGNDLLTQCELS